MHGVEAVEAWFIAQNDQVFVDFTIGSFRPSDGKKNRTKPLLCYFSTKSDLSLETIGAFETLAALPGYEYR